MYRIGIDVGSTYTKYCVMDNNFSIIKLFSEKTPIRQKVYFEDKVNELKNEYPDSIIVSCGYGKKNISPMKNINELTALAKGAEFVSPNSTIVLDIGGQDTKVIRQRKGELKEFFINDKCAAGSGMFLNNVCNLLGKSLVDIELKQADDMYINLSSVCAVFAQSEIVELIADNISENEIIAAVIRQILVQSKALLGKVDNLPILLSGGMTQINGIKKMAEKVLCRECSVLSEANFYSAIGCSLYAKSDGIISVNSRSKNHYGKE